MSITFNRVKKIVSQDIPEYASLKAWQINKHKKEIFAGIGGLSTGIAIGELHQHLGHKLDKKA